MFYSSDFKAFIFTRSFWIKILTNISGVNLICADHLKLTRLGRSVPRSVVVWRNDRFREWNTVEERRNRRFRGQLVDRGCTRSRRRLKGRRLIRRWQRGWIHTGQVKVRWQRWQIRNPGWTSVVYSEKSLGAHYYCVYIWITQSFIKN